MLKTGKNLNCMNCHIHFNSRINVPLILPCTHILCQLCVINQLEKSGQVVCWNYKCKQITKLSLQTLPQNEWILAQLQKEESQQEQINVKRLIKIKQGKLIQIIRLRRICKSNANIKPEGILLGKIPLLLTKYEIAINLCYQFGFQFISTVVYGSNIQKTYKWNQKKFMKINQNISKIDLNATQVEQIQEESFIISGANVINKRRFILLTKRGDKQFQMQNGRSHHRTNFDGRRNIYIISGYNDFRSINNCEMFDAETQSFFNIAPIPTPVNGFGSGLVQNNLYAFGGSGYPDFYQKCIQRYDVKTNEWNIIEQALPQISRTSAIYLPMIKGFLIYKNSQFSLNTLMFDLKTIKNHGTEFFANLKYDVYTQPSYFKDFVYQYDGCPQTNLYDYDLKKGFWAKFV